MKHTPYQCSNGAFDGSGIIERSGALVAPAGHAQPSVTAEAIAALNGLQSNVKTLSVAQRMAPRALKETESFLNRIGIAAQDLNKLNAIHVAGTKGKGSTCAFVESMLRHSGYRTGFYSSPHLIHVRERIRLNGKPLSEAMFTKYFWQVYQGMKVDVAIVEVGVGGAFDSTNIIPRPVVCGITTLDLDHTSLLGKTIQEIAWQKSGIFKEGVFAISVLQEPAAIRVLEERAKELKASLHIVEEVPVNSYLHHMASRLPGPGQRVNLPLAVQLANAWLAARKDSSATRGLYDEAHLINQHSQFLPNFALPSQFIEGISRCVWPGRYQIVNKFPITYFLDGSHTPKSVEYCAKWFSEQSKGCQNKRPLRVLIFNCTMDRKPSQLLPFLVKCDFDLAIFSPNCHSSVIDSRSDTASMYSSPEDRRARSEECRDAWLHCLDKEHHAHQLIQDTAGAPYRVISVDDSSICPASHSLVADSVSDALDCVKMLLHDPEDVLPHYGPVPVENIDVLVTGSLHLVGAVLSSIDGL